MKANTSTEWTALTPQERLARRRQEGGAAAAAFYWLIRNDGFRVFGLDVLTPEEQSLVMAHPTRDQWWHEENRLLNDQRRRQRQEAANEVAKRQEALLQQAVAAWEPSSPPSTTKLRQLLGEIAQAQKPEQKRHLQVEYDQWATRLVRSRGDKEAERRAVEEWWERGPARRTAKALRAWLGDFVVLPATSPSLRKRIDRVRKRLEAEQAPVVPWKPRVFSPQERFLARARANGHDTVAVEIAQRFHRFVKRLYQSTKGEIRYGNGGHQNKTWRRRFPTVWKDGGCWIDYDEGLLVLENHRGEVVSRLWLPDLLTITFTGCQDGDLFAVCAGDRTTCYRMESGALTVRRPSPQEIAEQESRKYEAETGFRPGA
jgi:hypothetical protein